MLDRDSFVDLYRELRDQRVLSIFIDGRGDDPGARKVWRTELQHQIEQARKCLEGAPSGEAAAFESAYSLLSREIDAFDTFVPGKGWVGFATAERLVYSESVPVPMPTVVRWEDGLRAAPYVRGLKQDRVVATVLVDSRRARIFEYRDGELVEPEALRADTFLGDLTDAHTSKRASTHTGTRGETGTDAAQRALEVTSERMVKRLVEAASEIVGEKGLLIVGGMPEMVSAVVRGLPKGMDGRVAERPSLHLEMSAAEVKEAVEAAASELSAGLQADLVGQVVDQARSGGLGCLGREETERALVERRVDTLVLARGFIRDDPDFADHCVGTAFEQHAGVEEVSGDAEERLLSEAGGIGARLRYRIREEAEDASAVGAAD